MTGLLDRVNQTILRHRMLERGQTVGVAVSGGADSVCLLHVLLELSAEWDWRLVVLHLNHRLRGRESEEDAAFVGELAARLGLRFDGREAELRAGANLEQAGREARMAIFREVLASGAADRVATGHTQSDQAETVLFRFLRGAGTAGMAAVRPVTSEGIVRPLLEVAREEVEEFLRGRGIGWREDSTNASPRFARNRIRHDLLPQLAADWNSQIRETLARTADWALAEESYWAKEIDRVAHERFAEQNGAILVRASDLSGLPLAVARRLVRRAIERVRNDSLGVDFHHIETILGMASTSHGSGRVQLPGVEVVRSFDWLQFGKSGAPKNRAYYVPLDVPGVAQVPGCETAVRLELIEKAETSEEVDCVYNNETGCLDWGSLSGSLVLRNWRPGDRYRPVGSSGKQKIKTLFQKARIPLWERGQWPIVTHGASIVWVRQFGVCAEFAAHSRTRVILKVREAFVQGNSESGSSNAASKQIDR